MTKTRITLVFLLTSFVVASRLVAHPANFVPVSAVAIFASVYLGRRWGPVLAVGAMFISDAIVGFYDWRLMAAVYGSFLLIGLIGRLANANSKWTELLGLSVVCSVVFFLVTNAAVWMLTPVYSRGLDGLFDAYVMGLPFFRNTLAGDAFFTVSLFGLARVARYFYLVRKAAVSA